MTAASFADAEIQDVVDKLTTEEAISLISGVGLWSTAAVSERHRPHSLHSLTLAIYFPSKIRRISGPASGNSFDKG